MGVHICCVDEDIIDCLGKKLGEQAKDLKTLFNFQQVGGKKVEDPTKFPMANYVLTVVKTGEKTQQVWTMLREANCIFNMPSPLAIFHHQDFRKLRNFCSGRDPVYLHPSLYRAVKLTFPKYIGGISYDGTIKTEMGQGRMGPAVGVLSPGMFGLVDQHQ